MKKIIGFILFICITFMLFGCDIYREEFSVYYCGSGISFNRNTNATYYIDELGIEFEGNTPYLEDYFYSEALGQKYTIRDQFFEVGEVYLAKKSDYYNDTVYTCNVNTYPEDYFVITSDMYYVHFLGKAEEQREFHISVEPREVPLDITFENVNICTKSAIPVFFSATPHDINITLIGKNDFQAGSFQERSESISPILSNRLTRMENQYKRIYDYALAYIDYVKNMAEDTVEDLPHYLIDKGVVDLLSDRLLNIGKISADIFETGINEWMNIWAGKNGSTGIEGITCFFHFGGICFTGDGTISVSGGQGGKGGDADASLTGKPEHFPLQRQHSF